ncbi:pentatricopeptide repeat-containing protein At1g71060, mitochondrial [Malania oleifera]|uniref:pentatricopeptide repeat-containing protein At1g71060, mitochondrial n=1 Tax=Malania oleifera TaxID=397392 RepID=UPI0025ADDC1A|nr:pentatricopeptide repeat-containing protein At1g71060, mitochondrial [Malania oleifera]
MGLFRFLNRLPKLPKTIKHHYLICNLICHDENSSGFSSRHNSCSRVAGFQRYVHGGFVKTQGMMEAKDKRPDVLSCRVVEDAEKLCKILSNHRDSSGVESALNCAGVEVSPVLVVEVLKKLSNAGAIALFFFRWAEKQKGFKYTTESYNALIDALGKIKQFKMIWNLVGDMKHKGLLARETFALISRRYARVRKVKEAIETFEKMQKFGMSLEASDYNRLIDTLCKSRHVKNAQEVFDKWKRRKFMPDIKSYTILLEGWGQEQNLLRLKEVYGEMRDEGFQPDVVTYGIIINAHCKVRKYDEAIEIFREMEEKNCKPSPHIYCTLINGLGSEKRLNEALEFFEQSKTRGFPLEIPTYNAVVGSYCSSMRIYDAYRMVDEMRKTGVGPNSRTYDIILYHLIKARRTKEAYLVFQKMNGDPGCAPTVSTYEIMVRMFCNEERVDMALKVWDEMKAKGVLPGMHMFSTLINCLCHENKLDDACEYFQEMLNMGIRPPSQMFSSLKQALLDEGKMDTVLILGKKLEKLRKTPLIG